VECKYYNDDVLKVLTKNKKMGSCLGRDAKETSPLSPGSAGAQDENRLLARNNSSTNHSGLTFAQKRRNINFCHF
jgi:hypothetical protein